MVRKQVCIQRTHDGGLGMSDLETIGLRKTGLLGPILVERHDVEAKGERYLSSP